MYSAVFRFETGLHDVVQVSRREFEDCLVENPFQKFLLGPATVPLDRPQVYYYICTLADYCRLGMKLAVKVHPRQQL
ncbi:hypothetical protein Taro_037758 [Colocasia esculenta]|uniref:Phytocyanin domain-containing protein n=1 Tax=Colocasia esculenta TaxID=4460 RepID=A0A843WAQ3_COLES|nr:hypothetical protein [Colocasia esculenta]